jgi:hypothetical protein
MRWLLFLLTTLSPCDCAPSVEEEMASMREMIMELKAKFEQQDEYGAVIVPLAMTLHKDKTLALGLIMFFVGILTLVLPCRKLGELFCKGRPFFGTARRLILEEDEIERNEHTGNSSIDSVTGATKPW